MHSEEYKKVLQDTRNQEPGWGSSWPSLWEIRKHLRKRGRTILDYGCGQGQLKKHVGTDFDVTNYDPGVPEYDKLPDGPFTAVVSNHVMEHIETDAIDQTLIECRDRAQHMVFHTIPHTKAQTILTDGRNAHLIVESKAWWWDKLKKIHPPTEWSYIDAKHPPNVVLCTGFVLIRKQDAVQ